MPVRGWLGILVPVIPMTHCLTCDAILQTQEKQCYSCGTIVPHHAQQANFSMRFATAVRALFFVSIALTVASVCTNVAPPFKTCLGATLVLGLVSKSARQMAGDGRDS